MILHQSARCVFWRFVYTCVGEEGGSGSGVRAGRAQRTYRGVQHYELQPGVKQRHAKLGDQRPSPLNNTEHTNLHISPSDSEPRAEVGSLQD